MIEPLWKDIDTLYYRLTDSNNINSIKKEIKHDNNHDVKLKLFLLQEVIKEILK